MDIEKDLLAFLKPFNLPTLDELLPSTQDPSELDLDGQPAAATRQISSIADYGLGSLQHHPIVCHVFAGMAEPLARREEVVQHLRAHLLAYPLTCKQAFDAHLQQVYQVDALQSVGLVVQEDLLGDLVIALKEGLRANSISKPSSKPADAQLAQQTAPSLEDVLVRMKPPQCAALASWLEAVSQRTASSSDKKPSAGRLRSAVQDMMTEILKNKSTEQSLNLLEGLVEAASEYAHMQLGSGKQMMKKIDVSLRKPQEDFYAVASPSPVISSASGKADFESKLQMPIAVVPNTDHLIEVIPAAQLALVLSAAGMSSCAQYADVGRFGEQLVYHYLTCTLPASAKVEWLNQDEESTAAYDLLVKHASTDFIEVKTSRYTNKNVFEITWNEWQFATGVSMQSKLMNYHIYRVSGVEDSSTVQITILKDLPTLVQCGRVKLCLAV